MIARLLAKAHRALDTARRDLDHDDPDAAANRCYYADYTLEPTPRDKTEQAIAAADAFVMAIEQEIDRVSGAAP